MFEVDEIYIAQSVRMMRTGYEGTIIIVEGGSDIRAYSNFMDPDECRFIPAYGKENAIKALQILESENHRGLMSIVDADLFHLESVSPKSDNLFFTDTHDFETMVLRTDIMDKIISEFVDTDKTRKIDKPINIKLIENALILGYFRWINSSYKENLDLEFKGLNYDQFIDKIQFEIELNNLIEEVKLRSDNYSVDSRRIKLLIIQLIKEGHDPWQVCRGHDITEILSFGLNMIFGFRKDIPIRSEKIEKILRISYGRSHFEKTVLFSFIDKWESINNPFKVLKRCS
jgi:hypothetical protein